MPIVHTLMREHMSIVNARQFSPARTDVTIEMALDAIGADFVELLLTDDEDGVWQINADVTIPANVVLHIPLGVTLIGPGDVTILGGLTCLRWPVHLGPGVIIQDQATLGPFFANLRVDHLYARLVDVEDTVTIRHQLLVQPPIEGEFPTFPDLTPVPNQFNIHFAAQFYPGGVTEYLGGVGGLLLGTATANSNSILRCFVPLSIVEAHGFHYTGMVTGTQSASWVQGTGGGTVDLVVGVLGGIGQFSDATVVDAVAFLADAVYDPNVTIGPVQNYYAFKAQGAAVGHINAYGFWSNVQVATGWYNFYALGTAPNYLNGNTGIGGLPTSAKLFVNGTATKPSGGSWTDSSMRKLKSDIRDIASPLDTLLRFKGQTFVWSEPMRAQIAPGPQWGLIAEDVREVMPGWIDETPEGELLLTLRGEFALTVEAIRELASRVTALEDK